MYPLSPFPLTSLKNERMFFVTNRAAKFTDEQKQEYEKIKKDYFKKPKQNLFF